MIKQIIAHKYLLIIFLIAIGVRFLFFPNNIYFGYDQARDAYEVRKILNGDLLLGGPTTLLPGLNHGVLYYYIYAPFYFFAKGDPTAIAILHRVVNALGVVLIFYLSSKLFNKKVGVITAIIFAFSFEQTQFALYLNHPSFGVLSVMLMYLGLVLTIFKKNKYGLVIAALGLGLSIQFEFVLIYLAVPLFLILIQNYKALAKISFKVFLLSFLVFLFCILTFILSEIKFNFKSFDPFVNLVNSPGSKNYSELLYNFTYTISNQIGLNVTGSYGETDDNWTSFNKGVGLIILGTFVYFLIKEKEQRPKIILLGIWFFSVFIIHLIGSSKPFQYHNVGVSLSLLIFLGFVIERLFSKNKLLALVILFLIITANLRLVTKLNPNGTITDIHVQQKMLLSDQKKVLDIIYQDAKGEIFAAKAMTMPFAINTTWSYLYQWYGKQKYGYEPIWGDKNAAGFEGGLKVNDAQHQLPAKRYLVIEPLRGVHQFTVDDYLRIEGYFTKVEWEKKVGEFKVQKRYLY